MGQTDNTVWTQQLAQVKTSLETDTICVPSPNGCVYTTVLGPRGVYKKFYGLTDDQIDNPDVNPAAQAAEADIAGYGPASL